LREHNSLLAERSQLLAQENTLLRQKVDLLVRRVFGVTITANPTSLPPVVENSIRVYEQLFSIDSPAQ
jgi:hypothetical protein